MKRVGGKAKPGHKQKHISDGDVFFEYWQAEIIFQHIYPHFRFMFEPVVIYDECANDGVLGTALEDTIKRRDVIETSLFTHDIKDDGVSALDYEMPSRVDVCVCNPPWKEAFAKPLFHRLYNNLDNGGVLIYIINNVFMYQGVKRARELKCQKFYFLPRYIFKGQGRPLIDCGVAIRHKGDVPNAVSKIDCFIDIPR